MPRKERKTITKDIYDLIISMSQNQSHSIKYICDILNLDRKTVRKQIQNHENGKEFVSSSTKMRETCRIRQNTFNNIDQLIFNSVSCNNSLIQKELATIIENHENITISQPTISRKLSKMQISRKRLTLVPKQRNTEDKKDMRAIYACELGRISDSNLVFLDETGFNKHTTRSYGYSLVNTKAHLNVDANKGTNISLMCAIDDSGLLFYQYKQGSFTSETFIEFLNNGLGSYLMANPAKILIMDNAAIHKSALLAQYFQNRNIRVKYTVPYSPELNPIEEFFSMIKSRYHSARNTNSEIGIEATLDSILCSRNDYSQECRNFFINMRRWLERARRREDII